MIKALRALLGKTAREHPTKNPAPGAGSKPSDTGRDYRAVSLAPGGVCCVAAKKTPGKRYLLREAPRLPLVDCTMPTNCSCKFRKHTDLRDSDRRALGAIEASRWLAASERRKRGGRRPAES
jgi:hypothetical protein